MQPERQRVGMTFVHSNAGPKSMHDQRKQRGKGLKELARPFRFAGWHVRRGTGGNGRGSPWPVRENLSDVTAVMLLEWSPQPQECAYPAINRSAISLNASPMSAAIRRFSIRDHSNSDVKRSWISLGDKEMALVNGWPTRSVTATISSIASRQNCSSIRSMALFSFGTRSRNKPPRPCDKKIRIRTGTSVLTMVRPKKATERQPLLYHATVRRKAIAAFAFLRQH